MRTMQSHRSITAQHRSACGSRIHRDRISECVHGEVDQPPRTLHRRTAQPEKGGPPWRRWSAPGSAAPSRVSTGWPTYRGKPVSPDENRVPAAFGLKGSAANSRCDRQLLYSQTGSFKAEAAAPRAFVFPNVPPPSQRGGQRIAGGAHHGLQHVPDLQDQGVRVQFFSASLMGGIGAFTRFINAPGDFVSFGRQLCGFIALSIAFCFQKGKWGGRQEPAHLPRHHRRRHHAGPFCPACT